MKYLFTSESVSQGHPDKVCDQISDAILDAMLAQDKNSRVACETLVTTGLVVVAGEITSNAVVDIQGIVRKTIAEIGYNDPDLGFDSQRLRYSCVRASAVARYFTGRYRRPRPSQRTRGGRPRHDVRLRVR